MSRMSTLCPNCALRLAVTAADLRVGQGYVRCGRCEKVFNALATLSDDPLEAPAGEAGMATGTTTVPALDIPATTAQDPDIPAPTGAELVAAGLDPWVPAPRPVAVESSDVEVVETLATGTFETIVLEGDGVLQTEEMVDEAEVNERLQEIAQQINGTLAPPRPELDPVTLAAQRYEEEEAGEPLATPPRPHRAWTVGALLLALLLAGQLIHHYRQALVVHPWAQRLLAPVYAQFGQPLEPAWRLGDYDVRQLGAEASAGNPEHILVRAAILNRAAWPQPLPLLRITLQDRFGNALAAHDVSPQDYLPATPPPYIGPDQRMDAQTLLADPGNKAVGFEIDVCLPTAAGTVRCQARP
jgi:predicted Zn finger-like uncharacterized protein